MFVNSQLLFSLLENLSSGPDRFMTEVTKKLESADIVVTGKFFRLNDAGAVFFILCRSSISVSIFQSQK